MKTTKATGLITLTHVLTGHGSTAATTRKQIAVRAADVEKVEPLHSAAEPEVNSYITVGDKVYWLAETLEQVVAVVNARIDQEAETLERIATVLENWYSARGT